MNDKITALIETMKIDNLDISFFNDPKTIQLLTGFESEPHERILALILFSNHTPLLFTPALDQGDAENAVSDIQVFSYQDFENPWEVMQKKILSLDVPTHYWAIEKQSLTVAKKDSLATVFPESSFDYNLSPVLEKLRLRKNKDELAKMKEAGRWADEAIKIGARVLKEGITEQEVVAEIEYELKKQGISSMSFDTMVLFGPNAASPHGIPGPTKLKKNQFVLFDLGVFYQGYASDITRTLFFGTDPTEKQKEIYHLVLKAHDQAMENARVDMPAEELDSIARTIIANGGYGEYFNHRLGHGLGQSVHEFPSIMAGNNMALKQHMCFSIEPGIYLPGQIGVRIEDCGYLDKKGFNSFTEFPTDINAYKNMI